ncbi:MAG: sulfate ABC transporter substrate-binding protein [Lysobacterales bacterium]
MLRTMSLALALCLSWPLAAATLLNASFDSTREFYRDLNAAFVSHWQAQGHAPPQIQMSHGGSGKQARSVIAGLDADVVSLALPGDIDQLASRGLLPADWAQRLPQASAPYTSTIVMLVRAGNPKGIQDWADLARPNIGVITASPKSSGGARWVYLAIWGGLHQEGASDDDIAVLMRRIVHNVPVWDSSARGATTTFIQRGIGDVLLTWESEALLSLDRLGQGEYELVRPRWSIQATPSIALVDSVADAHGSRDLALAYLQFHYSREGQSLAARHHFRPIDPEASAAAPTLPAMQLFTVEQVFGSWAQAETRHFADGASFDQAQAEH